MTETVPNNLPDKNSTPSLGADIKNQTSNPKSSKSPLLTFLESKNFFWIMGSLLAIIILLGTFQMGLYVGYRKAQFAFKWADSYQKQFGGPPQGFWQDFKGQDFMSGHGTAGRVVDIDKDSMVVKGQDAVEKIILLNDDDAIVRRGGTTVSTDTLRINDRVVIIGSPNEDGSINAKMIRLFGGESPDPSFPNVRYFKIRF